MQLTMYEASVPVCTTMLGNLSHILEKGEAFAEAKDFDTDVLFNSRLVPDMYPLYRQVQIATDLAKSCGANLAGVEEPKYNDEEKNYAELYERIDKTVGFLDTLESEWMIGSEEKEITLQLPKSRLTFSGIDYLLNFVHPNFYFHVTTAYNILRHNGVELGKLDYIGTMW